MLNRKHVYYLFALILQLLAFVLMIVDPKVHGFGLLTLWIAPILLFAGLIIPALVLANLSTWSVTLAKIKANPFVSLGFVSSFAIALVTYLLTLAPTASLWDCSETIAAAYKLQVPHTPGTPLTLLLGRLFSMLSFGDVTRVAWCINLMSGFFSALAVAFVFLIGWSFGQRWIHSKWVLLTGSFTGALILTYSDSFWFSAVEAETYGPSVFFMVFLIWLSMRPGTLTPTGRTSRVLLLSYIIGLSYCIHPMCILILPVCVVLWRARLGKSSWKHLIISFVLGVLAVLFISKVIAVDIFEWAFLMDLLFVNHLSLPVYSGVVALLIIIFSVSLVVWRKFPQTRLYLQSLLLLLVGFSPYLMLFIRSTHLPPINEFVPGDLAKIKPYMNRESYPSRPLIRGPYFDAKIEEVKTKAKSYVLEDGAYKEVGDVPQYAYDQSRKTLLPRIYSNEPRHIETYREWTGLGKNELPRFSHNLKFMVRYQLGHMYARYFLWNFAGRLSDRQYATWAKPWDGLADRSATYSRSFNQYFLIPLLLGLIGLLVQAKRDRTGFFGNMVFFLITGVLLAIYLNGTPNEPRERDYIYVGSYVAYSIWAGLGVMSLFNRWKGQNLQIMPAVLLLIPAWMAYQNWDDHDRSGRTFQIDYARAVLDSCEKNGILFTGGDNDTFPLWYLQEVEGFRTDVRVKVMSYFNADWYINQLSRPYYDSPPVKLTLQNSTHEYGPYDPVYLQEKIVSPISWNKYMDALNERNPNLIFYNRGSELFILPSKKLRIKTSKGDMLVDVNGTYLPKSEMAILDVIASNDWNRPIYFNYTSVNSLKVDLNKYVVQEGLLYKLTPSQHPAEQTPLDIERTFNNLIKKPDYSNLANADVHFTHEDYHARMITPLQFAFNTLISGCLEKGLEDKADEAARFALDHLYHDHLPPSYSHIQMSQILEALGRKDASDQMLRRVFDFYVVDVEQTVARGEMPSRNGLIVLQEAVRRSNDRAMRQQYDRLLDEVRKNQ